MAKRGYKTMEEAEKAKKDKNELRKGKMFYKHLAFLLSI